MAYSVLVVDDDDEDFMLLATHMKQCPHCQQTVSLSNVVNGLEATKVLTNGLQPHLILVDAQMPMMNGYEFVVWLMSSEVYQHIPIIIWTGAMSAAEVTRHYRAGANAVVLKQDALGDVDTFCHHWFKLVQLPQLVA